MKVIQLAETLRTKYPFPLMADGVPGYKNVIYTWILLSASHPVLTSL